MLRFLPLFYLIITLKVSAQAPIVIPKNNFVYYELEKSIFNSNKKTNPSAQFYLESDFAENGFPIRDTLSSLGKISKSWFGRKMLFEPLATLKGEGYHFQIDPLYDFQVGKETGNPNNLWWNGRAIRMIGDIGNKVAVYTALNENQQVTSSWVRAYFLQNRVDGGRTLPGEGPAKFFKERGVDYGVATGYLTYKPSDIFEFELGYGKRHLGNGYRSMILSDAVFNYPYFRVTTNLGPLKYTALYAQFSDNESREKLAMPYRKKYMAMHHFDYAVTKRFNIGFVESVVWQQADDSLGYRGFEFHYVNPIVLLRPLEWTNGSPDNVMIALNASYKIGKQNLVYGQWVIDEMKVKNAIKGDGWWANKFAYQLGTIFHEPFKVKNLRFQAEWNLARPFTYTHRTPIQAFTHFSQSIAHPAGANFWELLGNIYYRYDRWYAFAKVNYILIGKDTDSVAFGSNVNRTYNDREGTNGHFVGQGVKTEIVHADFKVGFILNPRTNARLELSITNRNVQSVLVNEQSTVFLISLRTQLQNIYHDFL